MLVFSNTGKALSSSDGSIEIKGFQVETAGSGKFEFVTGEIVTSKEIEIFSPDGKPITAVRYAWADNPGTLNLVNSAGLPAYPFRTDDYHGISYDARYHIN